MEDYIKILLDIDTSIMTPEQAINSIIAYGCEVNGYVVTEVDVKEALGDFGFMVEKS